MLTVFTGTLRKHQSRYLTVHNDSHLRSDRLRSHGYSEGAAVGFTIRNLVARIYNGNATLVTRLFDRLFDDLPK
jgi:hypothetical protein